MFALFFNLPFLKTINDFIRDANNVVHTHLNNSNTLVNFNLQVGNTLSFLQQNPWMNNKLWKSNTIELHWQSPNTKNPAFISQFHIHSLKNENAPLRLWSLKAQQHHSMFHQPSEVEQKQKSHITVLSALSETRNKKVPIAWTMQIKQCIGKMGNLIKKMKTLVKLESGYLKEHCESVRGRNGYRNGLLLLVGTSFFFFWDLFFSRN